MSSPSRPGDLARSIIARRWPTIGYRLAAAPGFDTLQLDTSGPVQTLTANGLRLASAWDPDAEAALQVAHLPSGSRTITLYGVGMGSLPELLLRQLSPDGELVVVLMNVSLFATMLDVVDQSDWLQHPAVTLTLASDHEEPALQRAITPALLMLAEASAERLRDHLLQALSSDHTREHLATREACTLANMAANEITVTADPDVAALFADRCTTAVVVAAGPSLDLSLERISELQAQGARIICVDAALLPLLNAGIRPDCIVTLDPQPGVRRFFETDLDALQASCLVYFPHVDSKVIQHWPWSRYVAYTTHERYAPLRERVTRTSLFTSGSVIHPATDLAMRMGATTVYLAGADFGYPFGTSHASGSTFCKAAPAHNASGLTLRNYAGDVVPTEMNFLSYYRDLEAYIGSSICAGRRFINLGQYSARIAGVAHEANR